MLGEERETKEEGEKSGRVSQRTTLCFLENAKQTNVQSLSTGGRCPKDVLREVVSCPFIRLWLVLGLGPAGLIRGRVKRGREVDSCGGNDEKIPGGNDGSVIEECGAGGEGGGGEGVCNCVCRSDMDPALGSCGMGGKGRLLDISFESVSDILPGTGVSACNWERKFELEWDLEFELGFGLVGDGERAYDRERTSRFVFKRGVDGFGGFGGLGIGIGDLEGGSNPGGRMYTCIPRLAGLTKFRHFWSMSA